MGSFSQIRLKIMTTNKIMLTIDLHIKSKCIMTSSYKLIVRGDNKSLHQHGWLHGDKTIRLNPSHHG